MVQGFALFLKNGKLMVQDFALLLESFGPNLWVADLQNILPHWEPKLSLHQTGFCPLYFQKDKKVGHLAVTEIRKSGINQLGWTKTKKVLGKH